MHVAVLWTGGCERVHGGVFSVQEYTPIGREVMSHPDMNSVSRVGLNLLNRTAEDCVLCTCSCVAHAQDPAQVHVNAVMPLGVEESYAACSNALFRVDTCLGDADATAIGFGSVGPTIFSC